MHASTFLLALLPLLTAAPTVTASHNPPHLRHRKLAEQAHIRHVTAEYPRSPPVALEAKSNEGHKEARKVLVRRNIMNRGQQCRPRATTSTQQIAAVTTYSTTAASSTTAWSSPAATTTSSAAADDQVVALQGGGGQATTTSSPAWTTTTTSSSDWSSPTSSSSSDGGFSLNVAGLLAVNDGACGWCDSNDNQPNGAQEWLNCGIASSGVSWTSGSGWAPPYVTMDQLIASDLDASGVFAPCAQYIDKFNQYGAAHNVHPIMLASFAMQESTCNAGATGGNGEAGLMQIAPPNCEAGNNCWDVDYNINRGAQLFSQMISSAGGNVLQAIGSYNGWQLGMTVGSATNAKNQGHCFAQNNLDYLYQFTNGWMQNKNANSMGSYFNLNGC